MRRLAYRLLFIMFDLALLATLVIAFLGAFTPVRHPIGDVFWLAVLLGVSLWAADPTVNGRFLASEYLWPGIRIGRR